MSEPSSLWTHCWALLSLQSQVWIAVPLAALAPFTSRQRPVVGVVIRPAAPPWRVRVSDSAPGSGEKAPFVPLAKVSELSSLRLISARSDCGKVSER